MLLSFPHGKGKIKAFAKAIKNYLLNFASNAKFYTGHLLRRRKNRLLLHLLLRDPLSARALERRYDPDNSGVLLVH